MGASPIDCQAPEPEAGMNLLLGWYRGVGGRRKATAAVARRPGVSPPAGEAYIAWCIQMPLEQRDVMLR